MFANQTGQNYIAALNEASSNVSAHVHQAPHDQTNHQKCSLGLLFTCSTSYTISTPDLQTTTFANRNRYLWLWTLASYPDLRLHAWVAGRGGAIWKWYKIKWYKIKMARNAPFLVPHSDGEIAASDFKMVTFKIWLCCLKDQMKDEIVTKKQARWAQISQSKQRLYWTSPRCAKIYLA